ncbi:uroporphyrinogen-III C-methyltransferase [Marinilabilia sp.]|uniref:uroporphyrinogen-III C-methyltransferase n=1 Tax=Marinilabilia sp. TaxID=2021252 RepID=UPI0025B7E498|nr:uroporphyrinogen-III C-methyltransferase [Marinilabilia sp.]
MNLESTQMEFLPISINITNKKVLFIGGGKVALQKIKSLSRFDAQITVVSTAFDPEVEAHKEITCITKSYESADLDGYFLVYACTDSNHTNEMIREDCHKKNILVCVADMPKLCDFISPAIYKTGNTTISVSSNARNAKKSVEIRNQIQKIYEQSEGHLDKLSREENGYNMKTDSPVNLPSHHSGSKGKVILAGFGPGDPGLLTLKANQHLQEADIIFHDALLDVPFLDRFPGQKVSVGKRCGKHHKRQDEINKMLVEAAQEGKKVVRLKGGDPFIFGRGGEEISHLRANRIDVEVIPGITSAFAAAAQYVLPLTHRKVASSVAFCSGHDLSGKSFPKADTLVFYMGANKQCEISQGLIEEGWPPDTPVALLSNISNLQSKAVISRLDRLCQEKLIIDTPLLIVVGKTVSQIPQDLLPTQEHSVDQGIEQ